MFRFEVSEDNSPNTCLSVPTDCTDPLGGTLMFVATGNNGTKIFNVPDFNNGTLGICSSISLKNQYGKWIVSKCIYIH